MPGRARRIMDQEVVLTTLTASGVNSFGEVTFQETVTSGVGFLKITDRLVSTDAGAIPAAQIELLTDPRQLSPSVRSTAARAGRGWCWGGVLPRPRVRRRRIQQNCISRSNWRTGTQSRTATKRSCTRASCGSIPTGIFQH